MENIEQLVKTTLQEVEKVLSSKTVIGEPMVVENNTIIPLVSVGFGFGAGGGTGKNGGEGSNQGAGGATGGGGVKPVAILVVTKDSVRLEPIKSGTSSVLEKVVETCGQVARQRKEESS